MATSYWFMFSLLSVLSLFASTSNSIPYVGSNQLKFWKENVVNEMPQALVSKLSPMNKIDSEYYTSLVSKKTFSFDAQSCLVADIFCTFETNALPARFETSKISDQATKVYASKLPNQAKFYSSKIPDQAKVYTTKIPDVASKVIYTTRIPNVASKVIYKTRIPDVASKVIYTTRVPDVASKVIYTTRVPDVASKVIYTTRVSDVASKVIYTTRIPDVASKVIYTTRSPDQAKVYTTRIPDQAKVYATNSHSNHHLEEVSFFRVSILKPGNIIHLDNLENPFPHRSFLPSRIASKISINSNHLQHLFPQTFSSPLTKDTTQTTILNCNAPTLEGEVKKCAKSLEEMIEFSKTTLKQNHLIALTTKSKEGSGEKLKIDKFHKINSQKSVSCHEIFLPFATYFCHLLSSTNIYVVDLVDLKTNVQVNTALVVCHMDTSSWAADHPAFKMLNFSPGKGEACHWMSQADLVWVGDDVHA